MVNKIILPLVRLVFLTALVKGGFLWLEESRHIYVDRWVATMIGAIESMAVQAPTWVGWTLVGGLGLVGATIWELIKRRTQRAKAMGSAPKEEAPPSFIRARNTTGTKIIGSFFRGGRTHIDAEGAVDFEAVDNVHLEAEGPVYWSLAETLSWMAFGEANTAKEWAKKCISDGFLVRPQEETDSFNKAEHLLFEALRGRKICALGKKNESQQYEKIPPEYFLSDVSCAILHDQIDINPENIEARSKWDGPKWYDVRFKREAVLLLWPQGKEGKVEFVPLSNAASQLYTEARKTNKLAAAASEWGDSDEETLNWWGGYIAVTKKTRLFGIRPPSNEFEEIDRKEVESMHVEGGAGELTSTYNKGNRYTDLKILYEDFRPLLDELKEQTE